VPGQAASTLTDEQRRIKHLIGNLLATLDAVVTQPTSNDAVEDARRALTELDRVAATVTTASPASPTTWTFFGHWEHDEVVVDYAAPGVLQDERQDHTGAWPEGLWAAVGSGATVKEAEAEAIAAYKTTHDHVVPDEDP
jgi:hypothetical protein